MRKGKTEDGKGRGREEGLGRKRKRKKDWICLIMFRKESEKGSVWGVCVLVTVRECLEGYTEGN